jgi:positive regulator of sigma E activity
MNYLLPLAGFLLGWVLIEVASMFTDKMVPWMLNMFLGVALAIITARFL